MDISSLTGIGQNDYMNTSTKGARNTNDTESSFDSVLSAAMNMLNETNDLQNDAESAKIQFALGQAENPHDMQIAAQKALTAINYTVAIRDKMVEAYREIMNMQI